MFDSIHLLESTVSLVIGLELDIDIALKYKP